MNRDRFNDIIPPSRLVAPFLSRIATFSIRRDSSDGDRNEEIMNQVIFFRPVTSGDLDWRIVDGCGW